MKRALLICAAGALLSLEAGFFDTALQQAGSLTGTTSPAPVQSAATANPSDALLSTLTGQLGVSPKQAAGGTAALMSVASQSMPQSNYAQLLKSVPGLSSLVEGNEGLVNGAMQMMGGDKMVDSAFQALGMDSGMVRQFAPLLLNYIKPYATPENVALLKQAWNAFL